MSGPWRFSVVGSWFSQNTLSSSSYDTREGSYSIATASACPVFPEHTSSYLGLLNDPPVYPTDVDTTTLTLRNASSTPQKQPAANVAFSIFHLLLSHSTQHQARLRGARREPEEHPHRN